MSQIRWNVDQVVDVSFSTTATSAAGTTSVDLNLADESIFKPGTRLLLALSATRGGGTTDTMAYSVQMAPDSSGSIGTPVAATTSGTLPSFAANSGAVTKNALVSVRVLPGYPWVRFNVTQAGGGGDSFTTYMTALGIPPAV